MDFELCIRENQTCADLAQPKPHLIISEAKSQVIRERVTELISTSNSEFAKELIAQGCTTKRNATAMTCDLTQLKISPTQNTRETRFIEEVDPEELFDSWNNAYGPTHPDHIPGNMSDLIRVHLQPLLDRTEMGDNHRSSLAVMERAIPITGIIISLREGAQPFGGPWISEIWVDPSHQHQGLGKALINQALEKLKEDNYSSLGLAVTNGNQAKALYEDAGFTTIREFWTIALPKN